MNSVVALGNPSSVYISMVLSFLAAASNYWGYTKAKPNGDRVILTLGLARAVLALLYFAAYIWLLFNPSKQLKWSETLVGAGWITWLVVWIGSGLVMGYSQMKEQRKVARLSRLTQLVEES